MLTNSKKVPLIILFATALASSRAWFMFLNDPEGPNLLVVGVLTAVVYGLSMVVWSRLVSFSAPKRVLSVVLAQLVILAVLYLFLG